MTTTTTDRILSKAATMGRCSGKLIGPGVILGLRANALEELANECESANVADDYAQRLHVETLRRIASDVREQADVVEAVCEELMA